MRRSVLLGTLLLAAGCGSKPTPVAPPPPVTPDPGASGPDLKDPRETHLRGLTQLSFGGENAEAYWSFDGTQLIFQTTREPYACDVIMTMPADGSAEPTLVSTGTGRTTCSYFLPGDQEIVYSSTHEASTECPPPPDHSRGYVWALYDTYEIYRANADGSNLRKLTDRAGYDAEATVCPVDGTIVFTSDRDGDLELYKMKPDGSDVVRLTHTPGYDGGAFFNADCTKLVWRASRPLGDELADYQALLAQDLIRPSKLEIYVANADGSEARQVTYLDAASFGPYFFPSSDRIIFSTNHGDPKGREFDLWAIDVDGTDLERITYSPGFDGFPMFSPDGTRLAFASNRNQGKDGETNMFVAEWVDGPPVVAEESAADRFAAAVAVLADDALGGRAVGTDGIEVAAKYIEDNLRAVGAEGGMQGGGFRQPFEVTTAIERGPDVVELDGVTLEAASYLPLSFSSSKAVEGQVIAVGHGVSAKGVIDEYKGKNVKGKIVLVKRFVPATKAFADEAVKRREGDLHRKAITARQKGAIGMIVIDVPGKGADEAPLPALDPSDGDLGIVAVAVRHEAGQGLLAAGKHRAKLSVALTPVTQQTDNVVGVIRAGAATKEPGAVVIGAHYDHLGMGGPSSLDGKAGIHNGADDNASGVAALIEAARILKTRQAELTRDVWLVAFSAEEMGVVGSTHFTQALPTDEPLIAMLNMDMVGRMRDNTLQALGAESATEWGALLEPICAARKVRCVASGSGYGPSDHMPFYIVKVPVLHFFTGGHLDYHKTGDDADKINAGGGVKTAEIVADTALALAAREPLAYQAAPAPPSGGDRRARGGSLGTIPAYTEDSQPGMLISDVVPEGPAQKAGLRGGDRILQIGAVEIRTVHDLMYVLVNAKPGEKAKLTYARDGKNTTVEITFGPPRGRI